MGREPLTQIQEMQRVSYKINPRRNTPKHILIKLTKIKDKEKNTESRQGKKKKTNNIQGNPDKVIGRFFSRNSAGKKGEHDVLNEMKEKNPPNKITLPSKALIRFEREIKSFTDKQKLKEFSTTKPVLQQILKELIQAEKKRLQPETKISQMISLTSKDIYTVRIGNHPRTIMLPKSEIMRRGG